MTVPHVDLIDDWAPLDAPEPLESDDPNQLAPHTDNGPREGDEFADDQEAAVRQ